MNSSLLSIKSVFFIFIALTSFYIFITLAHGGCDPVPNATGMDNSGVMTGAAPTTPGQNNPPPETKKDDEEPATATAPTKPSKDKPKKPSKDKDTDKEPTKPEDDAGGYNPLDDPNVTDGEKPPINVAKVNKIGDDFQKQTPGGETPGEDSGTVGGGDPIKQPDDYTSGTIGKPPEPPGPVGESEPSPDSPPGSDDPEDPNGDLPTKPGIDVTEVGTAPPGKCKIVAGQLVSVEGYPKNISGKTVVLSGPISKTTTSSAGGSFSFPEIPAGDYTISVKGWDYGMTSASLKAPSGKSIKIVLKGSCPYLYVWTGDQYEMENDIYSTARLRPEQLMGVMNVDIDDTTDVILQPVNSSNALIKLGQKQTYKDYYRIQHAPSLDNKGRLSMKIVERAGEHSYTDLAELWAVSTRKNLSTGVTRSGRFFRYPSLSIIPVWRDLQTGAIVQDQVIDLYDQEGIELSLPVKEAFDGSAVSIEWRGFIEGDGNGHTRSKGKPTLELWRKNPKGQWERTDWIYPRDERERAFLTIDKRPEGWDSGGKVRLKATSCWQEKFHRIYRLGWAKMVTDDVDTEQLPMVSAHRPSAHDEVMDILNREDNRSLHLGPSEAVMLYFNGQRLRDITNYDFFFVSKGFYIPASRLRVMAVSE